MYIWSTNIQCTTVRDCAQGLIHELIVITSIYLHAWKKLIEAMVGPQLWNWVFCKSFHDTSNPT